MKRCSPEACPPPRWRSPCTAWLRGARARSRAGEPRVAAPPETVKKLAAKNEIRVQAGAGAGSSIPDRDYEAAGARLVASAAEACDADIVLTVRSPQPDLLKS